MFRSVFTKTTRDYRGAILGWGLGVGALGMFTLLLFPSIRGHTDLDALWRSLPESVRNMFGGEESITTLPGYLSRELLSYLPVLLGIFLIGKGSAAVAGEEDRRTIDLLMAQPVTRRRVVTEKLAAMGAATVAMAILVGAGLIVGTLSVHLDASPSRLLLSTLNAVPAALVVGTAALAGSCLFRRRTSTLVATAFVVVSYFLNALAPLSRVLRPWRRASIFYFYERSRPLTGGLDWSAIGLLLALSAALFVGSVMAFDRKDLSV